MAGVLVKREGCAKANGRWLRAVYHGISRAAVETSILILEANGDNIEIN